MAADAVPAIDGAADTRSCANARPPPATSIRPRSPMAIKAASAPPIALAVLPLVVVVGVNLHRCRSSSCRGSTRHFWPKTRWGATSLSAVGGVWAVVTALAAAIVVADRSQSRRLPSLRASMDAGANASVLPVLSVASLVGFGAVVAALPAFAHGARLGAGIGGGPLVSLAVATNVLAALTGSASGGLTIALDALGGTYMQIAAEQGIDPGADASRRGDRRRHARQPAAQRRGGHAARGLRLDASRELSRYRHGRRCRRAYRVDRGDRIGHCLRIILGFAPPSAGREVRAMAD